MKLGKLIPLLVPFATWLGAPSCTDNPAAYEGILGPAREPSEGSRSSGGTGAAGAGGVTGGSSTGGTSGSTGAPGGEGGMGEGGAGTGGSGATGGGTVNPPPHPDYSPACFLQTTQDGEEIMKGTPCTSADVPLCYRPCGPNQVGWKTETCTAGVYAEGDCSFPTEGDYSCYAIPDVIDTGACGVTAPPRATEECTAPKCMSCNFDGFYEDTGTDVKLGFCTCRDADAGGVRRWTCASETAWPCPFSQGC